MIEKIDGLKNNPERSSTTKVSEDIFSVFSVSTISSFKDIENKHDVNRGKDCTKKFCEKIMIKIMNLHIWSIGISIKKYHNKKEYVIHITNLK